MSGIDSVNADRENPVGCHCGKCGEFTPLEDIKHMERGKGYCPVCTGKLFR